MENLGQNFFSQNIISFLQQQLFHYFAFIKCSEETVFLWSRLLLNKVMCRVQNLTMSLWEVISMFESYSALTEVRHTSDSGTLFLNTWKFLSNRWGLETYMIHIPQQNLQT